MVFCCNFDFAPFCLLKLTRIYENNGELEGNLPMNKDHTVGSMYTEIQIVRATRMALPSTINQKRFQGITILMCCCCCCCCWISVTLPGLQLSQSYYVSLLTLPLSLLKGRPPVFHRTEGDRQERRWNPWVFGHSPVLEAGLAHDKL